MVGCLFLSGCWFGLSLVLWVGGCADCTGLMLVFWCCVFLVSGFTMFAWFCWASNCGFCVFLIVVAVCLLFCVRLFG